MSEDVIHIGKIKEVKIPSNLTVEEVSKHILFEEFGYDDISIRKIIEIYDYSYVKTLCGEEYNNYFYFSKTNKLYHIEDQYLDGYNDIIEAKQEDDGSISYILKFHNGGTGMAECLVEALDKLTPIEIDEDISNDIVERFLNFTPIDHTEKKVFLIINELSQRKGLLDIFNVDDDTQKEILLEIKEIIK